MLDKIRITSLFTGQYPETSIKHLFHKDTTWSNKKNAAKSTKVTIKELRGEHSMINGGNSDRLMSDINVTPFVDVMLVLLVIFMVTAPMMMQGVDVVLPETTSQPLIAEKEHLIITITNKNQVFINDFQVAPDFLQEKLKKILEGREDRGVYLRADREIPYGFVVQVMSEIKEAGVEKLGMVTEPVNEKKKGKKPKAKS